jgi:hypothetical protein
VSASASVSEQIAAKQLANASVSEMGTSQNKRILSFRLLDAPRFMRVSFQCDLLLNRNGGEENYVA